MCRYEKSPGKLTKALSFFLNARGIYIISTMSIKSDLLTLLISLLTITHQLYIALSSQRQPLKSWQTGIRKIKAHDEQAYDCIVETFPGLEEGSCDGLESCGHRNDLQPVRGCVA
jgi:hypothetical protein